MRPLLQVQIVTYNSEAAIGSCLDTLLAQSFLPERIVIIDNDSTDQTKSIIATYIPFFQAQHVDCEIIPINTNTGYAAGHNRGIQSAISHHIDLLCTLNPDIKLDVDYLKYTVSDFRLDEKIGGVTGKLIRSSSDEEAEGIIDSTGLQMEAFFHARDRGQDEKDRGQYNEPAYVWGVCGAAALYRVKMLAALAYQGQYFDENFFVYKEDVDLCWRGQSQDWKFYYEPRAFAFHGRGWKKGERVSPLAQTHSFANQIALLIKHVPKVSFLLLLSLLVELIRLFVITLRSPEVAKAIIFAIRSKWAIAWEWRRGMWR